jgi:hypothetical protein
MKMARPYTVRIKLSEQEKRDIVHGYVYKKKFINQLAVENNVSRATVKKYLKRAEVL